MTNRAWMCTLALLGACVSRTDAGTNETASGETQALALESAGRVGCDAIRCREGYVCEEGCFGARCTPAPTEPRCTGDEDCRLEANYCTGCDCVALAENESLPKCPTTPVQCLVDPCNQHEARCEAGRCVVAGSGALQ